MHSREKIKNGQFFTKNNPFTLKPFINWSKQFDKKEIILEPFAGANGIIKMLQKQKLAKSFVAYDIEPKDEAVQYKDTIKEFPEGFKVGITNPPYLAKNSATRKKIAIDLGKYEDLYQLCLEKALEKLDYFAAIIPESFTTSGLFTERLQYVISLNSKMFEETDCPVCLALWGKKKDNFKLYRGNEFLGSFKNLKKAEEKILNFKQKNTSKLNLKFNLKAGELGLLAIDNTKENNIKFCEGKLIAPENIKVSSRALSRIALQNDKYDLKNNPILLAALIKESNKIVDEYRKNTKDVFLTSFKGLRKDNKYRRRMDFKTAKKIVEKAYSRIVEEKP